MSLTNFQIEKLVAEDKFAASVFHGVFPSCCLPRSLVKAPASFIINLDEHFKKGSHWVAIHFKSKTHVEYFDSYGLPPQQTDILLFLERNCDYKWKHNNIKYQGQLSTVCGYYCILYILYKARNLELNDKINDKNVKQLIKTMTS